MLAFRESGLFLEVWLMSEELERRVAELERHAKNTKSLPLTMLVMILGMLGLTVMQCVINYNLKRQIDGRHVSRGISHAK